MNSIQAMTGLPAGRRKVRRGGGRHQMPKKPAPKASPDTHLEAVQSAMASGDHAAAKTSALHLVKALHAMQQQAMPTHSAPAPLTAE